MKCQYYGTMLSMNICLTQLKRCGIICNIIQDMDYVKILNMEVIYARNE